MAEKKQYKTTTYIHIYIYIIIIIDLLQVLQAFWYVFLNS